MKDFELIPDAEYETKVLAPLRERLQYALEAFYFDDGVYLEYTGYHSCQELNIDNVFIAAAEELCSHAVPILEDIGLFVRSGG